MRTGDPSRSGDGGLQAERTALAWSRTGLVLSALMIVVTVKVALHQEDRQSTALFFAGATAASVVIFVSGIRRCRLVSSGTDPAPARLWIIVSASGTATLIVAVLMALCVT
ncbi:DUF202 domain-containing protein [Gordonia jinhuaensis]|uniref:DUF202 domain-containing protein n=1 Tax=Gordonia jinhuaensis TaxID=1517702 RepID=UPI00166E88AC|nr:DUF202 domain-containing protein [Gordonia jinhuaensis]